MNKIDVIVLKKNIFNSPNFVSANRIYKLSDFKREFPFIDTSYKEYFAIDKVNLFENGQKVRYNGENWYILKFDYLTVENNAPDARYVLCKSYTDKKSRRFYALASKIVPIDTYYFINSSGEIHLAEAGNAKADNFRKKSGNVFVTKEDAEERLDYILNGKFQKP